MTDEKSNSQEENACSDILQKIQDLICKLPKDIAIDFLQKELEKKTQPISSSHTSNYYTSAHSNLGTTQATTSQNRQRATQTSFLTKDFNPMKTK